MNLTVSQAPHIHEKNSVSRIMLDVIIALIPTTLVGIFAFGINSAILVFVSIAASILSEFLWQKLSKRKVTISDLSAVVTGLILALNLPSTAPWWIAVIGSVFAIIVVKQLFGGLGGNFLNPAMAARAALLAGFPAIMTNFVEPFSGLDAISSATPLSGAYKCCTIDLLFGNIPGTIGEVCKIAILLGFIYLMVRRVVFPAIPVLFVVSASLFVYVFSGFSVNPVNAALSGGLLFGAVFMATDYTTTPMTSAGSVIFAVGAGLIVALIRSFGSYAEGVTYAILLMNTVTPLIDKYVQPKIYGDLQKKAEVKKNA